MLELIGLKELKRLAYEHYEATRDTFKQHADEQIIPKLAVTIGENPHKRKTHLVFLQDFDERRYDVLYSIGAKYGEDKEHVIATIFISEAWMTTRPVSDKSSLVAPSKDPNRQEVVIICGMTIELKSYSMTIPIETDSRGKRSLGKPLDDAADVQSNLLNEFWRGFALAFATMRNDPKMN